MDTKHSNKNMQTKKIQEDCIICTEKKYSCNIIECSFCNFKCCSKCTMRFLMEIEDDRPRCMNPTCKKVWSWEFLSDNTPHKFHNKNYRDRRAHILHQQEKALLPGTQPLLEILIQTKKINKEIEEYNDEINMFAEIIRDKKKTIRSLRDKKRNLSQKNPEETKRQIFTMACVVEDCRGFLSSGWKCGVCEVKVCKDCHVVKDEEHKCDPDLVKTISLLRSDTKGCPSCQTPIYKIRGCDQMYCTMCHTAFSWRTGNIERGVIHNPHFYDYQRQNNNGTAPRVARDFVCGGLPDIYDIEHHVTQIFQARIDIARKQEKKKDKEPVSYSFNLFLDLLHGVHRKINHMRHAEMLAYPHTVGNENNSLLRIKFLLKEIDEKEWKRQLRIKMKRQEKNTEIHQILDMLTTSMSDIFTNILACTSRSEIMKYFLSLHNIRLYANKILQKIQVKFGNVTPGIDSRFHFYSNNKYLKNNKYNEKNILNTKIIFKLLKKKNLLNKNFDISIYEF